MSRREHAVRDVPGRPDLVQIDVLHGLWAILDRDDLDAVTGKGTWCMRPSKPGRRAAANAVRINLPRVRREDGSIYRQVLNLGQFILELHGQPKPGNDWHPDHKNSNPLDNRLVNLRWLPKAQNLATRRAA